MKEFHLNIKGSLMAWDSALVMGILNVTPDSFYDGGVLKSDLNILSKAEKMLNDGASILDVGGYSSRPGADDIDVAEEKRRVVDTISLLSRHFPEALISIDTFRSEVARDAIDVGASIINDITGGEGDPLIIDVAASSNTPYIMMHMQGTPQTMQSMACYDHLINDILDYFSKKISHCRAKGVNDIIVDPGFGFAKTIEQNYELLGELNTFSVLEVPILVGLSRKSMIYKSLNSSASEALNGTTVLNTVALQHGANIIRVHDVKEAVETIKLLELIPN